MAIKEMDGPDVEWQFGRTDYVDDSKLPPRGRLPDGAQGVEHIRFIFYRMGFNNREIVALSGAHNLGRCHSDRSGFHGAWVNNPTRFSNQYFKLMTSLDWRKKRLPNGVEQFVHIDEDLEEELVTLPTDLALLDDPSFSRWVHRYAKDKEVFFADFARVFAKLIELGIQRDETERVINTDNVREGYFSAPKKAKDPGQPGELGKDGEAEPLAEENMNFRARL